MCVYDGYPKGVAKDYFGSHKEYKIFVNFNYKVLDDDYVNNLKANHRMFQKKDVRICLKTTIKYIQK